MTSSEFDRLLARERAAMLRYAQRLCQCLHTAEDVVQEAAIRAWGWLSRNRLTGSPTAWLRAIVRNCHIDRNRAKKVLEEVSLEMLLEVETRTGERPFDPVDPAPTPERALIDGLIDPALTAAIDALPSDLEWQAVQDCYVAGYTDRTSAVNQRLFKARRRLRETLEGVTLA